MAAYIEGEGLNFINNENIDGLNRERLNLTIKGYSEFSLNLIESMKSI